MFPPPLGFSYRVFPTIFLAAAKSCYDRNKQCDLLAARVKIRVVFAPHSKTTLAPSLVAVIVSSSSRPFPLYRLRSAPYVMKVIIVDQSQERIAEVKTVRRRRLHS